MYYPACAALGFSLASLPPFDFGKNKKEINGVGQTSDHGKAPSSTGTAQRFTDNHCQEPDLDAKIGCARQAVSRYMTISGAPGLSVGVTKNGQQIWKEGFGYADVETGAPCTGDSVMRIASISKCLTAIIAARLMERGKLELDKSIHDYLGEEDFPKKTFNDKEVVITSRQLLSHTSGVRHYPKKNENDPDGTDPTEFLSNKRYASVKEALGMFKADPLVAAPGKEFHYTTHGFTLLSAVLEKVEGDGGRPIKDQMQRLFARVGMWNTFVEDAQEPIVIHRAKYYKRNGPNHRLQNIREVDTSYKIAGGGILSNVTDLLKFADAILLSYQASSTSSPINLQQQQRPLLKSQTIRELWTRHAEHIENGKKRAEYGLGWFLAPTMDEWNEKETNGNGKENKNNPEFESRDYWYHTGGAAGTSTVLLIKPTSGGQQNIDRTKGGFAATPDQLRPSGICIAILVNCQDCPCRPLAVELAHIFEE